MGKTIGWLMGGAFAAILPTLTAAPAASPAPTPAATWPVPNMNYFVDRLPGPPRPGSFRDRMDLQDAEARQRLEAAQHAKSIQETYLFDVFYFSKVLGPNFNARNFPRTAAFFSKLINTANGVVGQLKNHYQRPRPFVAHPDKIALMVKNEPGYSFPSGHTTRSRLSAFVLAELVPAYKSQIFRASELVATDRILAGEHYLTDLEAGRRLGKILFAILCEDMEFQAQLQALKAAEWNPPIKPLTPPVR